MFFIKKGNVMTHDTPLVKRAYNLGLKAVPNFVGLSAKMIAYYEQHLREIPAALTRGFIIPTKFVLLADLGIISVPDDYNHTTQLATCRQRNRGYISFENDDISDENFQNPSRILKSGDKLRVLAYQHAEGIHITSSIECMEFFRAQNAVFVGAQGISLVAEQKRHLFPKANLIRYASFDDPDRLWIDAEDYHRVPVMDVSLGPPTISLKYFESKWCWEQVAFLYFSDVPPEA